MSGALLLGGGPVVGSEGWEPARPGVPRWRGGGGWGGGADPRPRGGRTLRQTL